MSGPFPPLGESLVTCTVYVMSRRSSFCSRKSIALAQQSICMCYHMLMHLRVHRDIHVHVSHPRQFFHCLGCAVLLCLVCLFDLACFFLSSFSSLI